MQTLDMVVHICCVVCMGYETDVCTCSQTQFLDSGLIHVKGVSLFSACIRPAAAHLALHHPASYSDAVAIRGTSRGKAGS